MTTNTNTMTARQFTAAVAANLANANGNFVSALGETYALCRRPVLISHVPGFDFEGFVAPCICASDLSDDFDFFPCYLAYFSASDGSLLDLDEVGEYSYDQDEIFLPAWL
ncbi:MAG: hypothetical protein LUG45_05240 [Clostridiales bacterium]|nr:hypothetical protein [Clostridiales bacterium]